MKFLRILAFAMPFLLEYAIAVPDYTDDVNTQTGTFSVEDYKERPKQLEMQKEEAQEIDSFGNDEYNENVDPDVYEVDEKLKRRMR